MTDNAAAERLLKLREDIAAEFQLDVSDWRVRRLALLTAMFARAEDQAAGGRAVDIADLLALDRNIAEIRETLKKAEPLKINVQFVPGKVVCCPKCEFEFDPTTKDAVEPSYRFRARCTKCNQLHEYSNKPFDNAKQVTESQPGDAPAEPAKPAEPALTVAAFRGVSGSAVHDAVLSNGEIAPLKKLQPSFDTPRNVSPMSFSGFDPKPRRDNAPAGSARDEANPTRSN